MKPSSLFSIGLVVAILLVVSKSVYIVKETERGVKLQFGEVVEADLRPGLHFKIPMVNTVRLFDARVQTLDTRPSAFLTLEAKRLIVDSYVKWRISDVEKYYTATSGDSFRASDLLSTRIETSLRNEFGTRTLTEVVSGEREEVMDAVIVDLSQLTEAELGLQVVDVRVKRIDLPPEVSSSVYERMRTERERLARELRSRGNELAEGIRADADRQSTVIMAEAYRDSEIIRGEGDAEATRIYASSYNRDPEFYSFYRSLLAYKESFGSGSDILLLEPDTEFFRFLDNYKRPAE